MTPERIAEIRLLEKHLCASGRIVGGVIRETLDALDAANAEIQRLQSSPAPVGGGVPEPSVRDIYACISAAYGAGHDPRFGREQFGAWCAYHGWFAGANASRLPALKPWDRLPPPLSDEQDAEIDRAIAAGKPPQVTRKLTALKPGEVVVNAEEWKALLEVEESTLSAMYHGGQPSTEEFRRCAAAHRSLEIVRSRAQATTPEGGAT